jgi:hypothetical protein
MFRPLLLRYSSASARAKAMAGGSRAEREVQVRDSAQRAAAVVMPIDFRTMRDTSDGGATILLGNGRPYRADAQSRGSIRSMSASRVGTSGSLSHSETITVVFTAKMVLATQGPHESTRNYRRWGDALIARPTWVDGLDLSAGRLPRRRGSWRQRGQFLDQSGGFRVAQGRWRDCRGRGCGRYSDPVSQRRRAVGRFDRSRLSAPVPTSSFWRC